MRRLIPTLLLLALLPAAAAQALLPDAPALLRVEPFLAHAPPGGEAVSTPFRAEVACDAALAAGSMRIVYRIAYAPPWANVEVRPPSDEADHSRCTDGVVVFDGVLVATVGTEAPAFTPEAVRLEAEVTQPLRPPARAAADTPLAAGYLSVVQVAPERAEMRLLPGERGAALLRATNFGNGHTRVDFEILSADAGLRVEPPVAIHLGSRQGGDPNAARDVRIEVERTAGDAAPRSFLVRWHASYAFDRTLAGDSGLVSIVVLHGADAHAVDAAALADDVQARVPDAPPLLALSLAAALALLRRR